MRRLTGGGSIWHHHEVTYALVVPGVHPLAHPNTRLYRAVHLAITDILASLGVHADRRGDTDQQTLDKRKRPLLCFTDPNPEDIVTRGIKIVGSAQRRRARPFSNTVRSSWRDRLELLSFPVSATWPTFTRSRKTGRTGYLRASRLPWDSTCGHQSAKRGSGASSGAGADGLPKPRLDRTTLNNSTQPSDRLCWPRLSEAVQPAL